MTIHKLMVLIAPEPFVIQGNSMFSEPFFIRANGTALFKDTITRTLYIEDDDEYFDHPVYLSFNPLPSSVDQTGQTLAEDFNFSFSGDGHLLPKGTRLGRIAGIEIRDPDQNRFLVFFPYRYEGFPVSTYTKRDGITNEYVFARDNVIGGRQAVIIFPLNKINNEGIEIQDENGKSVLSEFNENAVFFNTGRKTTPDRNQVTVSNDDSVASIYPKCFAKGSLIQTPNGLQAVETLEKGDLILTRDHGPQPVIWTAHTDIDQKDIERAPQHWPILIRKNALGQNLPNRDLMVSPQHRILVQSEIARRMFDQYEVLVAAKHLLSLPGVEVIRPKDGISYWHILLPRHELVLSHGAWTESFYPGEYAIRTLAPKIRAELQAIVPAITEPDFVPRPVRRLLTGREGRKLAQRHVKNRKPLSAADQSGLQAMEERIILIA